MTHFVAPGTHLLIDISEAQNLSDIEHIRTTLQQAATACGATVLELMLHHFGEGHGVTGVAVLAESHISIHTWPEINYAAVDIFMCGQCNPQLAIPILEKAFSTKKLTVQSIARGQ